MTTSAANPSQLRELITPISTSEFFSEYWGQRHLLSCAVPTRHAHLFSWEALSEILSFHRFDSPRLRLFRGGRLIPADSYIRATADRRGNRYWVHDAKAVESFLAQGALLHITSIGETWAPLNTAAAQLEHDLCARVQVNLHAGYASSKKGFHTHWDGHDVYAVQLAGRKKWRVFGFTEEAPLPERRTRNTMLRWNISGRGR
jgi:ribosomal protein L16 Arg81 hydroxylase